MGHCLFKKEKKNYESSLDYFMKEMFLAKHKIV